MPTNLHYVMAYVADMEQATRFYRDTLGLALKFASPYWTEFATGETTLVLLGGGSVEAVRGAVAAFHQHWQELEKRRQKPGTHVGDYLIAPYFFYYGHRYCAQAIELLPEKERAAQRGKLVELIVKTRDRDGTWNDRVFPQSRGYCTAMVVLALLGERTPLPPAYQKP